MDNEELPNFNLGSSWEFSEDSSTVDEQPNFHLGSSWDFSDDELEGDEPMFDLQFDFSDDENDLMDVSDQDGDGEDDIRYSIEEIRQRNIAKFNVQGRDYRLKIKSLNRNLSYNEAVIALHSIIQGQFSFYLSTLFNFNMNVFLSQLQL